jgi:ribosomal protein S18 acetylase RimI-like enzyme
MLTISSQSFSWDMAIADHVQIISVDLRKSGPLVAAGKEMNNPLSPPLLRGNNQRSSALRSQRKSAGYLGGSRMEIIQLQQSHLADVVSLWNDAVQAQGQGYQDYILSPWRLMNILEDENFLSSGALVALSHGRLVGFALGYVQTVDFRREGDLETKPGRLAGLAARPDCWRQGVGRALLEAVEAVLAEKGRSAVAFETYRMPISLMHGIYVDSGPYRFLLACGYQPLEHELRLRNELSTFRLDEDIERRRKGLADEGLAFRWYEPADRDNLLQFMARHFSGGWHTSIQRAIDQEPPRKILLAVRVKDNRIVGFMGPFHVGEPGQRGSFGSPGVDPDFRRRGIGTVLFHLGLDYLKSAGAGYTDYGTGVTNPARFMYFKAGAQLTSVYCCNFYKEL